MLETAVLIISTANSPLVSFLFTSRLTGREPLVFLPGPFTNEPPTGKAHLKQCEQMTLTRRQKRLCRREPGLAETLRESVRLSLLECRYQFRSERWNCSLDGRGSLLKRGKVTRNPKLSPSGYAESRIFIFPKWDRCISFGLLSIPHWEYNVVHVKVSVSQWDTKLKR